MIEKIFATAATCDQPDAGVAVIWWAAHGPGEFALTALDYQLDETPAITADWIGSLFARSADLDAAHKPEMRGCFVRVEHAGLAEVLRRADGAFSDTAASGAIDRSAFDIRRVGEHQIAKWPATLDERAAEIRPLVNSGRTIKLETGLRRFSFRAIRTNHLVAQIKRHRPGDAASAGELLHAFVLGVLLGTRRLSSWFDQPLPSTARRTAPQNPFAGGYIPGQRPR